MFSKYLLPNLSTPIKVPRLVSPVLLLSLLLLLLVPTFSYAIPMFYIARAGVSKGGVSCGRDWGVLTCNWWPYSWEVLVMLRMLVDRTIISYLEADTAQVAQGAHNSRHGCGYCVSCAMAQSGCPGRS